jgi:hypothetical protein
MKLAKDGRIIWENVIEQYPAMLKKLAIPLLQHMGLSYTLYCLVRPCNDAYLFFELASIELPQQLLSKDDVVQLLDHASVILAYKVG